MPSLGLRRSPVALFRSAWPDDALRQGCRAFACRNLRVAELLAQVASCDATRKEDRRAQADLPVESGSILQERENLGDFSI